jgi:hypothetical protein
MDNDRYARGSIELRFLTGRSEARKHATYLGPAGLAFRGLTWVIKAPAPEHLRTDWVKTNNAEIRIADRELYNAQMRKLIGLE